MILIETYIGLMQDKDIEELAKAISENIEYAVVDICIFNAGAYIDIEYTNDYKDPGDTGFGFTTNTTAFLDMFMENASDEQKEIYEEYMK